MTNELFVNPCRLGLYGCGYPYLVLIEVRKVGKFFLPELVLTTLIAKGKRQKGKD